MQAEPRPTAKSRPAEGVEPLLVAPDAIVTCPSCQVEFSLAQGFASRSLEQLRQASSGRLAALRCAAEEEAGQRAAAERGGLDLEIDAIRAEMTAIRGRELELLRERAAWKAARESAEFEAQRRIELAREAALQQGREAETERWRLREAEYQKKLEDTMKRLDEAQRTAAQGSQQLQGEVLELVLEEQLRGAFPLDAIEEVKKGARGGDVVHRVMTRSGQQAGVILWEAKRAQNWSREWALKLKADLRSLGAEVGVIVTLVMPPECARGVPFDLYEEIWVTTPGAALALAKVLAGALVDVHKQRLVSANKGEKMEAVYDYVTSAQFAHKVRAIATTLKRLREELDSERTQTLQRWSRREKHLQQAVVELAGIGGDLQGLAQHDLPQLEIEPNESSPSIHS